MYFGYIFEKSGMIQQNIASPNKGDKPQVAFGVR